MCLLPSPPLSSASTASPRHVRQPSPDGDTAAGAPAPKRRAPDPLQSGLPPPSAGPAPDGGFAAPGAIPDRPDPAGAPAAGTGGPPARLLDQVAAFLRAHPGPDGHRTRPLLEALQARGVQASHKQVSAACNRLVKTHSGFIASKTVDRQKHYRVGADREVADFVCARRDWGVLLVIAAGSCRDYRELRTASGANRNQVNALVAQLRASNAAFPGYGLPRLDLHNRCLRRELKAIHSLLFPLPVRSPLPPRPQPEIHGRETYLRFLSVQRPGEWFSGTELARRFDTHGRAYRVSDCLKRAVAQGWVEVRYDERYCSYRLHPAYRAQVAEAARGLDWTRLLPPRPAVAATTAPAAGAGAGAAAAAAAAATACTATAESVARHSLPPQPRLLPDMDGFLESRGIPATAPGQTVSALDFLASRQPPWQAVCGAMPVTSRSALVRTLEAAPGGHALLCVSAPPAYLETWRDGVGVWRARSLLADAGRGAIEPLFLTAARFFDGPGPADRSLDIIHLQDTSPARRF